MKKHTKTPVNRDLGRRDTSELRDTGEPRDTGEQGPGTKSVAESSHVKSVSSFGTTKQQIFSDIGYFRGVLVSIKHIQKEHTLSVTVCLSVYLFVCPSLRPSVCLSVCLILVSIKHIQKEHYLCPSAVSLLVSLSVCPSLVSIKHIQKEHIQLTRSVLMEFNVVCSLN